VGVSEKGWQTMGDRGEEFLLLFYFMADWAEKTKRLQSILYGGVVVKCKQVHLMSG
jgi:hypothetical protein